jgi:Ca2+-binding RTX toxin-like protein
MTNSSLKGFILNGLAAGDLSGFSVSNAGDINGDDLNDILISSPGAGTNGSASGQNYVVFGSSTGFPASLNLSTLNGSNGFKINGVAVGDLSGYSVSGAGDINGDGFDDIIIGANLADPTGTFSGQSYLIFGRASGFSSSLDLFALNGSNGFKINGIAPGDRSGTSVSQAGDVNSDGIDDLIIGARSASPNGTSSGQSYVVFGRKNGFSSDFELATLNGSNGFIINGEAEGDNSGVSVSDAGDINGDGIDDLIVGASTGPIGPAPFNPNNSSSGKSYVIFGKRGGFSSSIELSTLNGSNGFKINGTSPDDRSGYAVSSAGDINGDGLDDLLIGSYFASPNGISYAGQSYVVFGSRNGFDADLDLSALKGSNGFKINGIAEFDVSGSALSSAGDVNGDGLDDLLIGAPYASPNGFKSGQSYVVFGSRKGFSADLDLSTLNGNNGFKINGILPVDIAGVAVSGTGDVNGDGFDDLIIGAAYASPNGNKSGQSYVIFGRADIGSGGTFELSQLLSSDILGTSGDDIIFGTLGDDVIKGFDGDDNLFGVTGNDQLLGGAGDDVLTGDDGNDRLSGEDGADLIYGDSPTPGLGGNDTIDGGNGKDVLYGGSGNDSITGGAGEDILIGEADNDTLDGGAGDDRIFAGTGDDQVFGQNGNDYIEGQDGNDILNGGAGKDALFAGLGSDIIDGGAGNDVLVGEVGNDTLIGGSGDDVLIGVDPGLPINGFGGTSDNPDAPFEIDILTGGKGRDRFYLGGDNSVPASDRAIVLNLNRNPELYYFGGGNADYALITDYNSSQDTLQLPSNVSFSDLVLGISNGGSLPKGITLSFNGDLIAVLQDVFSLPSTQVFTGTPGNDSFTVNSPFQSDSWIIQGQAGNDSLTGGNVNDYIYGEAGNDSLSGLAGNDFLNGGAGNDTLNGGAGNDTTRADVGNDTFIGSLGNDSLDGGAGTDVANYSNLLNSSSTPQSITLLTTGTVLKGTSGTDQLFKVETVIANASAENNTIDVSTSLSPIFVVVDLADVNSNLQVFNSSSSPIPFLAFNARNFDDVIGTNQNDRITGDSQNNKLLGNSGNDTINGAAGNDTIDGGFGNDSLNGGAGNDSLVGGAGKDILLGGAGNDFLTGVNSSSSTAGANEIDTLTGNLGNDRFVLADSTKLYYQSISAAAFGVNDYARINDFQSGVDKLVLKSGINYFTSSSSPVAGITGNFFVYRDNAAVGTLTAADDLVAAITGTFISSDIVLV